MRVLPTQTDWPVAVAFAADQKLLLIGRLDGSLGYFDPQNGTPILPPKPELGSISPPGIQRGAANRIELAGKHLASVSGLGFNDPKISARIVSLDANGSATLEITCPADLPTGPYEIKLLAPAAKVRRAKSSLTTCRRPPKKNRTIRLQQRQPSRFQRMCGANSTGQGTSTISPSTENPNRRSSSTWRRSVLNRRQKSCSNYSTAPASYWPAAAVSKAGPSRCSHIRFGPTGNARFD